jgi:hypothetical protein
MTIYIQVRVHETKGEMRKTEDQVQSREASRRK